MHPTLAATASASWPSRSVCSRSACAIATQGVVSADAKRPARRRRGVSSAQRRAATRSPHVNATRAVEATTRAVQSAVGHLLLHLGVPHRSIEPPRRSAATSPFRRYKFAPAQLAPIHGRRVRACSLMQVSMRHRLPHIGPNAQYCRIGRGHLRPLASQSATPRVANLRVVADGLPPSKAQSP